MKRPFVKVPEYAKMPMASKRRVNNLQRFGRKKSMAPATSSGLPPTNLPIEGSPTDTA